MVYSKFKILIIFSPSFPSFLYQCVLMYQYLYKDILSFWFLMELILFFFIFWHFCFLMDVCFFCLDFYCSFVIFYCSAISWQDWLSKASKWQVSNGFKLQLQLCYNLDIAAAIVAVMQLQRLLNPLYCGHYCVCGSLFEIRVHCLKFYISSGLPFSTPMPSISLSYSTMIANFHLNRNLLALVSFPWVIFVQRMKRGNYLFCKSSGW